MIPLVNTALRYDTSARKKPAEAKSYTLGTRISLAHADSDTLYYSCSGGPKERGRWYPALKVNNMLSVCLAVSLAPPAGMYVCTFLGSTRRN